MSGSNHFSFYLFMLKLFVLHWIKWNNRWIWKDEVNSVFANVTFKCMTNRPRIGDLSLTFSSSLYREGSNLCQRANSHRSHDGFWKQKSITAGSARATFLIVASTDRHRSLWVEINGTIKRPGYMTLIQLRFLFSYLTY